MKFFHMETKYLRINGLRMCTRFQPSGARIAVAGGKVKKIEEDSRWFKGVEKVEFNHFQLPLASIKFQNLQ